MKTKFVHIQTLFQKVGLLLAENLEEKNLHRIEELRVAQSYVIPMNLNQGLGLENILIVGGIALCYLGYRVIIKR